jgi:tetratricopeptide (TPR) repeat protein
MRLADHKTSTRAAADKDTPRLLALLRTGGRVYCAGRLASMDAEQFEEVLAKFGATTGTLADCAVAVVGEGPWPLAVSGSEDDRLSVLERLDARARAGLTVLGEREFLAALGLDVGATPGEAESEGSQPPGPQLFSTARLTELLGVSRERIRGWVKKGLIEPVTTEHGVWQFDFRQVSAARMLCDLAAAGVSPRRIHRALALLRKFMPGLERPLEQLAALDKGGTLLVRLAEGDLSEADGQLHFEFTEAPPPADASSMRIAPGPRSAADWLAQGLEQEREGFLEEAAASYRQALLTGGPDAQTCFNLANVLRSLGNKPQALERYSQAVEVDPGFADAWNNMGTLLVELDKPDEACVAFGRALAADPDDLRAHYNFADTLEEMGRHDEAAVHWRAYVAGDPVSEWGTYARRRLGN